ncbi:MAG: hypothetical protein Q8O27_00275, partial [Enterobacteriaceae bacterium]|nr:hypothetical protein [Enterobacteriaceae bacterium]
YENSGTFVNVSGLWQTFSSVVQLSDYVELGWKSLVKLSNLLNIPGMLYKDSKSVIDDLNFHVNKNIKCFWKFFSINNLNSSILIDSLVNVPLSSIYCSDSLSRRANCLQNSDNYFNDKFFLKCNKSTYSKLKLENECTLLVNNNKNFKFYVEIDNAISDNSVVLLGDCVLSFDLPYRSIY